MSTEMINPPLPELGEGPGVRAGVVTKRLIELLARQIKDEKVVVWYDPTGEYQAVADRLAEDATLRAEMLPGGTTVARYDGRFFALRHEVERLICGVNPPLLLVYVPMDRQEAQDALVELESLGTYVRPGQQPPARNTRLAVVARGAVREVLGEEKAYTIEKQVEHGKLSLGDLDGLAEQGETLGTGVVSVLYQNAGQPQEIALAFLTRPDIDPQITERGAQEELKGVLRAAFGLAPGAADEEPDALRQRFVRHLLVTDLRAALPEGAFPTALSAVPRAEQPAQIDACAALAREFRLRRDLAERYADHARRVEEELNLVSLPFDRRGGAAGVETFLAIERQLQQSVEQALLGATEMPPTTDESITDLVDYARERQRGFWATQEGTTQARWALIAVAGEVVGEAARIEKTLGALRRRRVRRPIPLSRPGSGPRPPGPIHRG